jgi:two-component system invasion response regulator UvrY
MTTLNQLIQLRGAVESLSCDELPRQKQELLSLLESIPMLQIASNGDASHQKLSPREREVMTMILEGRRLKEIGARLDISVKTVTTHRSRLLRKLGLDDNLGLYRYGVRNGLIGV